MNIQTILFLMTRKQNQIQDMTRLIGIPLLIFKSIVLHFLLALLKQFNVGN
jgi:hypothetical protein